MSTDGKRDSSSSAESPDPSSQPGQPSQPPGASHPAADSLPAGSQGGLPGLGIRRPWLVVVMNLLLIIAGLAALRGVEVRELPNIDRPVVSVRAEYPGAAPETLDGEVTRVLEAAAARVPGVYNVRSASEEGSLRVHIEFRPDVRASTSWPRQGASPPRWGASARAPQRATTGCWCGHCANAR